MNAVNKNSNLSRETFDGNGGERDQILCESDISSKVVQNLNAVNSFCKVETTIQGS